MSFPPETHLEIGEGVYAIFDKVRVAAEKYHAPYAPSMVGKAKQLLAVELAKVSTLRGMPVSSPTFTLLLYLYIRTGSGNATRMADAVAFCSSSSRTGERCIGLMIEQNYVQQEVGEGNGHGLLEGGAWLTVTDEGAAALESVMKTL